MSSNYYLTFVFCFVWTSIIAFKIANNLLLIFFPVVFDEIYLRYAISFISSTIIALAISVEIVNIALCIARIESHIGKPALALTIFLCSIIPILFMFEKMLAN